MFFFVTDISEISFHLPGEREMVHTLFGLVSGPSQPRCSLMTLDYLAMVIRLEHGIGQQLIVGRSGASIFVFAVAPESPELGPTIKNRLVVIFGRPYSVLYPSQSRLFSL